MNIILNVSEYKPDYKERGPELCPHCGGNKYTRSNRWLYRCMNYECGRYW